MKATRIYADPKGVSHFADVDVPLKEAGEIGSLAKGHAGQRSNILGNAPDL
jgi:hypothetical protein